MHVALQLHNSRSQFDLELRLLFVWNFVCASSICMGFLPPHKNMSVGVKFFQRGSVMLEHVFTYT